MNRHKAEEKGIGIRHRQKEVGIGRRQRNGQVKEIDRAIGTSLNTISKIKRAQKNISTVILAHIFCVIW